jgi:AcrR family transcriptional regulator
MTPKTPTQTRERLLDATLTTLRAQGAAGLTLDAVAKEAGVSKGGLLHQCHQRTALVERR